MNYNEQKINIRDGVLHIEGGLSKGFQQVFWIALFSVFYLLRDLAGVALPDIVFTGICAVAFFMTDVGTSLGIFMFTSALTIPHVEIRFVYVIILVVKLAFSGEYKMRAGMLLLTLGMLLLQLVDVLIYSTGTLYADVYDYGVKMLVLILPLFWYGAEFSAKDFRRALLCYVAGVVLGGTVILLLTADTVTWNVLLSGTQGVRLGATENETEMMQTAYNANQLAGMFAIAVAILVVMTERKWVSKLLALPLIGYSFFIIVLSRSRTGVVLVGLTVLIYYWVLVFRKKKFWTGLGVLLAVVLLAWAVFSIFPDATQALLHRFTDEEDITNGRADLFVLYLNAWSEDPWCFFFGYGIGSYSDVVDIWNVPHNIVTDVLISWGLLGLCLVIGVLILQYKKGVALVDKKLWVLSMMPAVIALIATVGGQYLSTGYPHMRLCFLLLASQAWGKTQVSQEECLREKMEE